MTAKKADNNTKVECDLKAFYRPVAIKAVAAALSIRRPDPGLRGSLSESEGFRWSPDFHGYPDNES